jgi:hypothetical protein
MPDRARRRVDRGEIALIVALIVGLAAAAILAVVALTLAGAW